MLLYIIIYYYTLLYIIRYRILTIPGLVSPPSGAQLRRLSAEEDEDGGTDEDALRPLVKRGPMHRGASTASSSITANWAPSPTPHPGQQHLYGAGPAAKCLLHLGGFPSVPSLARFHGQSKEAKATYSPPAACKNAGNSPRLDPWTRSNEHCHGGSAVATISFFHLCRIFSIL